MIVNTNIPFLITHNNSRSTSLSSWKTTERFSSGLRINRGEDDPSGLAVSSGAKSQIHGINTAMHNVQESLHIYTLRDAYMENISDMLMRMRELAVRAANEATTTEADRDSIQEEMEGLRDQIDQTSKSSQYVASGKSQLLYSPAKLDVVWVLDHSYSMEPYVNNLADTAQSMFDGFFEKGFDLQMGVISFGQSDPNALFDETQAVLGTPLNSTAASPSSGMMYASAGNFITDVQAVANLAGSANGLGIEQGLDAVSEALTLVSGLGPSLREDAAKVFILVTNEGSDDNGEEGEDLGWGGGNSPTSDQIQAVIDALNTAGVTLHVAGESTYQGTSGQVSVSADPDPAYQAVAAGTGGMSVALDANGLWVNPIVDTLENYVADWDAIYQVGPDNDPSHRVECRFMSVTSATLGVGGFDMSTVSGAQQAITNIDSAINTLNNERQYTAETMVRLEHILDDLSAQNIGITAFNSGLEDADFAEEAVTMAINQILENTTMAAQTQANANPRAAASQFLQAVESAEQVNFAGIFTVGASL